MNRSSQPHQSASTWTLIATLALASFATAQEKSAPDKTPDKTPDAKIAAPAEPAPPEPGDPNERTAGRLKKTTKINFENAPLNDVIDFLAHTANIDIVVIWRTAEQAGVNRDTPVTLKLKNAVPVEVVLRLVLRIVGGGIESNIEDGILILAAPEPKPDAPAQPPAEPPALKTEVYDLTDLIQKGEGAAPPEEQKVRLAKLITQMVAPESWRENGGSLGAYALLGSKLIIKQTEEAHTEIAKLILTIK